LEARYCASCANLERHVLRDLNFAATFSACSPARAFSSVTLDGEFTIEKGQDNAAVDRVAGAIYDRNISGENPGANHAVPYNTQGKRSGGVSDEESGRSK
jgi:hypothetical protein